MVTSLVHPASELTPELLEVQNMKSCLITGYRGESETSSTQVTQVIRGPSEDTAGHPGHVQLSTHHLYL